MPTDSKRAFRFVFLMSMVSLCADMAYEGARSVTGPFFAALGASGAIVGVVSGFGELFGFGIRYVSGIAADRTKRYWDLAIVGYAINVLSVPALALARTWPIASIFVVGERTGRGLRKPASSALISYAGSQLGHGWVFGFREAMDQTGATIGPLILAGTLFLGYSYSAGFSLLAIPAVAAIVVLLVARRLFPLPSTFEKSVASQASTKGHSREFWIYAIGAAFIAFGFADFSLIAFHLSKVHEFSNALLPILYACAMLAAAIASPLLGTMYDRFGAPVLYAVFIVVAAYAPLAFLGGQPAAIGGAILWGIGMAAQDTLFPTIVARITPPDRRASAFGTFDAIYGIAWFLGSALMGVLCDHSLTYLVVLSLVAQLAIGIRLSRLRRGRSVKRRLDGVRIRVPETATRLRFLTGRDYHRGEREDGESTLVNGAMPVTTEILRYC